MGNMKMGGVSMNCMKCGRELKEDGVFCSECLAEMDQYPVKPDTVVHLPRRQSNAGVKKSASRRKHQPSSEEQVNHLRKLVVRLVLALIVCVSLLIGAGYFAVIHLLETRSAFLPGQNYSSVDSAAPATEE